MTRPKIDSVAALKRLRLGLGHYPAIQISPESRARINPRSYIRRISVHGNNRIRVKLVMLFLDEIKQIRIILGNAKLHTLI